LDGHFSTFFWQYLGLESNLQTAVLNVLKGKRMLDLPAKNVKTTVIMGASIITMETYVVGVIVELDGLGKSVKRR